jgi:SSS family solute:Na+ symporter
MGTYLIGMLLISEFVATASTMGTSQAAFETGLSSAWVYISLSVGFILYAFLLGNV